MPKLFGYAEDGVWRLENIQNKSGHRSAWAQGEEPPPEAKEIESLFAKVVSSSGAKYREARDALLKACSDNPLHRDYLDKMAKSSLMRQNAVLSHLNTMIF